jgi:hypothetical protein
MRRQHVSPIIGWIATCWLVNATLVGICIAAANDPGDITTTIVKHEKAALDAFKTHDKKSYANLCLPSFYEITSGGAINSLKDQLNELDDYVLGEYRMDDVVVTVLSGNVALIRYKISAQYSFKGNKLPIETMLASAVWIKRGSDWKAATYQEVKVVSHP